MHKYQSFPGSAGGSNSLEKLWMLGLPNLGGKSFLDIGCNEGFFCGYAFFEGARTVTGVDYSAHYLEKARKRFPQCKFEQADWMEFLGSETRSFDVILCASAIHYAEDQPALVRAMVDHLAPGGVLVLEIGISAEDGPEVVSKPEDGWVLIRRSEDERLFPTWKGMERLLSPYAYKYVRTSCTQAGDPVARHVFHVRPFRPYAILMSGEPGSGKSTVARNLFPHLPIVDDGSLWNDVLDMDDKYPRMAILSRNLTRVCGNIDDFMSKYFDDAVWNEYFDMITSKGNGRTFVFEGYIPLQMMESFKKRLEGNGYMVVEIVLPELACSYNELIRLAKVEARKYGMFLAAASSRKP